MKMLKQLQNEKPPQTPMQCEFDESLAVEFKTELKKRGITIRSVFEYAAREFIKESKAKK